MLMNDLCRTELFGLLSESSLKVTNQEMQQAYENFVADILTLNQSETDFSEVFRSLNLTRIEFQSLQTQFLYEQGGKCLKKSILPKSNLVYRT